jgi:hypothetical protein
MSTEAINNSGENTPKIFYGQINELLLKLDEAYAKDLEKESWLNSQNPTAVLIKNLTILFDDLTNKYYIGATRSEEEIYKSYYQKSKKSVSEKVIRLVFKCGENAPVATEYLNAILGKETVEKYHIRFVEEQQKIAEIKLEELICVDDTLHLESPAFQHFVGKAKHVTVSTNKSQIEKLLAVLQKPDFYNDKIFQHPHVLYYAMAACRDGKMTPEQYGVLSQWIELKKKYGEDRVHIHRLFDENKNFTAEAREYILKHYMTHTPDKFNRPFISDDNLEKLRHHFLKLPAAEQIFISLTSCDEVYNEDLKMDYYGLLKMALLGEKDLKWLSFLPITAYQAFVNTVFPKHPATLKARLGPIDREDVKNSHNANICYVSTYFQRPANLHTPSSNRHFHKTGARTTTAVGIHDAYHALMLSSINEKALKAIQYTGQLLRDTLKIVWSSGIWAIADAAFFSSRVGDLIDSTVVYLDILLNGIYQTTDQKDAEYLPEISTFLLDIYFHPEKWSEKIDVKIFWSKFSKYKTIYGDVLDKFGGMFNPSDSIKLNLLKFGILYKTIQEEDGNSVMHQLLLCDLQFKKNPDRCEKDLTFKMATRQFLQIEKREKNELENQEEREESDEPEEEYNPIRSYALLRWKNLEFNSDNFNAICKSFFDGFTKEEFLGELRKRFQKDKSVLTYIFDNHFHYFMELVKKDIIEVDESYNDLNETFYQRAINQNNAEKKSFIEKYIEEKKKKMNAISIKKNIDTLFFNSRCEKNTPTTTNNDRYVDQYSF